MKVSRRKALGSLGIAVAFGGLAGTGLPVAARSYDDDGLRSGMVFTTSNAQAGNELLVFARGQDGTLTLHAGSSTGGQGSGAGLGSQGAVTLSGDGRFVFVVNAQSNSVSTFALHRRDLQLVSVVPSGGLHPISVTEHEGIVYVLSDAGNGNVAGFRNVDGELQPIAGSVRGLSVAGGAGPAQAGFSDDGDALVVTEKNTNRLTSYRVGPDDAIGAPIATPSPGQTPFGFAFNRRNRLLVTEAAGGAAGASTVSSYRFGQADPVRPVVVSASVPDTQSSVCWIAITPEGRYAYVANTGSSSVSSYRVSGAGQIELLSAVAGHTGAGSSPADTAISGDGRHLYVRNGGTFTISSFTVGADGTLLAAPLATGLPGTAVGLAAN
jgi:6-phosphogluconolactonase (cycloisomerase 2 family)